MPEAASANLPAESKLRASPLSFTPLSLPLSLSLSLSLSRSVFLSIRLAHTSLLQQRKFLPGQSSLLSLSRSRINAYVILMYTAQARKDGNVVAARIAEQSDGIGREKQSKKFLCAGCWAAAQGKNGLAS